MLAYIPEVEKYGVGLKNDLLRESGGKWVELAAIW